MLNGLPKELIQVVAFNLPKTDLYNLNCCSKSLSVNLDEHFWKSKLRLDYYNHRDYKNYRSAYFRSKGYYLRYLDKCVQLTPPNSSVYDIVYISKLPLIYIIDIDGRLFRYCDDYELIPTPGKVKSFVEFSANCNHFCYYGINNELYRVNIKNHSIDNIQNTSVYLSTTNHCYILTNDGLLKRNYPYNNTYQRLMTPTVPRFRQISASESFVAAISRDYSMLYLFLTNGKSPIFIDRSVKTVLAHKNAVFYLKYDGTVSCCCIDDIDQKISTHTNGKVRFLVDHHYDEVHIQELVRESDPVRYRLGRLGFVDISHIYTKSHNLDPYGDRYFYLYTGDIDILTDVV